MRLRLDLLEYLTAEDIMEAALESVHRYFPNPISQKLGLEVSGQQLPKSVSKRKRAERR